MSFERRIQALDDYYAAERPTEVHVGDHHGRIVNGDTPAELFSQIETGKERLPTMKELMKIRIDAVRELFVRVPLFQAVNQCIEADKSRPSAYYKTIAMVMQEMDAHKELYGVWMTRLTTGTHMVRAKNKEGESTVYFYDKNPFKDESSLIKAMKGELSDGGIEYDADAVRNLWETPAGSQLSWERYLEAKGGNFTGEGFLNHPIFSTAAGSRELMEEYTYSEHVLGHLGIYHKGLHSGWRPGEMKENFGRPISLGLIGEAFYPPNGSTVGHSALLLKK